jgi:hypothetical protein
MPGTAAFQLEYARGLQAIEDKIAKKRDPARGLTFTQLVGKYLKSDFCKTLEPSSVTARLQVLDACLDEPYQPGSSVKVKMGACPVREMTEDHIRV